MMKQSTSFAQVATKLFSTIARLRLLLVMFLTLTITTNAWGATYTKVTTAPTDWSGDYLIVYEDGAVAFNGALTTLDAVSNTVEVEISNNTIAGNDNIDEAIFTISKSGDYYTIKSASGKYIGNASNSNALTGSNETLNNTISINNDNKTVNIVSSGGAYLRYNASSGQYRFRYYKSSSYTSQKAICLYKKGITQPSHCLVQKVVVH